MIAALFKLELVNWWRDRLLLIVLCVVFVALVTAAAWAAMGDLSQRDAQQEAAETARAQWLGKGGANPHSMAHFGDFVFRPSGPLARLDHGVQARLGKVLFLEGHRQNVPLHADVSRAGSIARFERLDPAFLLQTIVPLLMIFLGATGLAADRESGRLKLLLAQGSDARVLLTGRFLALWGFALMLLASVVIASLLSAAMLHQVPFTAGARLSAFVFAHALFFAVVAAGITTATVWLRSATAALLTLLTIWVVATTVVPRASSSLAGVLHTLPSQDAFQAILRDARESGPDGHNPQDMALSRLRQATLDEYGVDNVEALPINFDGIAMQVDEEYGNRRWDEQYGALQATLKKQLVIGSLVGVVNPFQAIKQVSMTLAGTDLSHDLAFQQQAEQYRRELVQQLNHEHAYGGSRTNDWSWQAEAEFFANLQPFNYATPALSEALRARWPAILGLLCWCAVLSLALHIGARRLEHGVLVC